jgi:hypothetical protein
MMRYALVVAPQANVEPYLPHNYSVIGCVAVDDQIDHTVIMGQDDAGWTLDGYVLPRLASGLYSATEIDLGHPIMKAVPA